MNFHLKVWRQPGPSAKGYFQNIEADGISQDSSFLEMLDVVNDRLEKEGKEPIAFDHDCREGICGMCSLTINGLPHGPQRATTTCQLHMRQFKDGDTIVIEPFRAKAFPIVRDLMVNRSSFDRIIQSGGFVSVKTGSAPEANSIPVSLKDASEGFDAAACIGCGACVATCKNASAMLFVSSKIKHLESFPQGKIESKDRVQNMLSAMDQEGFGACTNTGECEAICPKEIKMTNISFFNRRFLKSLI